MCVNCVGFSMKKGQIFMMKDDLGGRLWQQGLIKMQLDRFHWELLNHPELAIRLSSCPKTYEFLGGK